jgi:hypothetical protein
MEQNRRLAEKDFKRTAQLVLIIFKDLSVRDI